MRDCNDGTPDDQVKWHLQYSKYVINKEAVVTSIE